MNTGRRDAWCEHHSEESGNRMGTILKIFFPSSPSNIKARDKGEREERKCSLPVEALTEDESFLGIKEAPSLIIPWWDASIPIRHSHSAGCHTRGGQRIQGEGQNVSQSFLGMKVVKQSKIFCFSRLKYQEFQSQWDGNGQNGNYKVLT